MIEVPLGDSAESFTLVLAVMRRHCASDESLCNQDPGVLEALRTYSLSPPGAVDSG